MLYTYHKKIIKSLYTATISTNYWGAARGLSGCLLPLMLYVIKIKVFKKILEILWD